MSTNSGKTIPNQSVPLRAQRAATRPSNVEAALRKPLKKDESFVVVAPEPIATLVSGVPLASARNIMGPAPYGCGMKLAGREDFSAASGQSCS